MKVVIMGQGPRSFYHPDDYEVWVINGPDFPPRMDVLFQLHGLEHIGRKHGYEFLLKLGSHHARLVMTQLHKDVPSAEAFPLERVKAVAGDYFTNSFPLVIAYAVLEGATDILLDGAMWAGGSAQWGAGEGWAVPCVEYHIGRARALGVKVTVPPGCGLFAHSDFVYGFEGPGSV